MKMRYSCILELVIKVTQRPLATYVRLATKIHVERFTCTTVGIRILRDRCSNVWQ